MTDFTQYTEESAPDASKPILQGVKRAFGMVPNLIATMAESPAAAEGYATLMGIFEESDFTPAEQQIVLMTNNRLNNCTYCMAAHSTISKMQGVPEDAIETLRKGESFADARLEALRVLTEQINENRGFVGDAEVGAFLNAGYTKANVLEVILGTSLKVLSNYTNHVANTPVDDAFKANAWRKITDAVHVNDGRMVLQLWHVGGIGYTSFLPSGKAPLAPSAIRADAQIFTANGFEDVSAPKELTVAEINGIVKDYAKATRLAMDAEFDGVEVHGANGYLLNQFIATNSNVRSDQYGGTVENRSRLLLEVVDAVTDVAGPGKVGVRLSPTGKFNDINDHRAHESYPYIYSELEKRNLSYLHVVERFPGIESSDQDKQLIKTLRREFDGNYIANGDYDKASASNVVAEDAFAVTFGRAFISNPDLPIRLRTDTSLAEPDQNTFYGGDERGYSDYPTAVSSAA